MKFVTIALLLFGLITLSNCSKKSDSEATTPAVSYGDLPSQLASDVY